MKRLLPNSTNANIYKSGGRVSPLRGLNFLQGDARFIRIDAAHTFAIDGVGKSYYASSIVVLMLQGWFGHGSTENKFEVAFSRFMAYCRRTGKSTSIYEFSFKALKLTPGSLLDYRFCFQLVVSFGFFH